MGLGVRAPSFPHSFAVSAAIYDGGNTIHYSIISKSLSTLGLCYLNAYSLGNEALWDRHHIHLAIPNQELNWMAIHDCEFFWLNFKTGAIQI